MSCTNNNPCNCNINVKTLGKDDVKNIKFYGSDPTKLNWTEVSVRELLCLPDLNPDIEYLNEVSVTDEVTSIKLIETPFSYSGYRTYYASAAELTSVQTMVATIMFSPFSLSYITSSLDDIVALLDVPASELTPDPITPILENLTSIGTSINAEVALIDTSIASFSTLELPLSVCNLIHHLNTLSTELNNLKSTLDTLVSDLNTLVEYVAALLPEYIDSLDAIVSPLLISIATLTNSLIAYLTSVTTSTSALEASNFIVLTPNAEDTCLTGRQIVVEGILHQSVMYTANVEDEPVYAVPYDIPFSAYIVVYPSFVGLTYSKNVYVVTNLSTCNMISANGFQFIPNSTITPDLSEDFDVKVYIENIFVTALDHDTIFKDVTLFISATPEL